MPPENAAAVPPDGGDRKCEPCRDSLSAKPFPPLFLGLTLLSALRLL